MQRRWIEADTYGGQRLLGVADRLARLVPAGIGRVSPVPLVRPQRPVGGLVGSPVLVALAGRPLILAFLWSRRFAGRGFASAGFA